jgi:hypothetical protein
VYLGNRYQNVPNIIWFHGNDFNAGRIPGNGDSALVGQVIDGIRSIDSNHLHTILLGRSDFATNSDVYSNEDTDFSSRFGCDAAYTFSATPNVTLNAYNSSPTTPVFLGEGNYETENILGYPAGGSTPYRVRAENYGTLTWGGIGGILYGHSWTWQSTWVSDPITRLNSAGMLQIAHINTLMTQVGEWWNLEPDQTHSVVTAGYGTVPGPNTDPTLADYCTTSANSTTSLTYCPNHTTLTVAMSNFNGPVTARWYDPSDGTFIEIDGGPFANSGSRDFTMPGNNADADPDWLLLLTVCNNQLSSNNAFFPVTGGAGSFNLSTSCDWTAISNDSWIEITSASAGSGNATITYIVSENLTNSARQGTMTVGGLTFTVTQDGGIGHNCTYDISPSFQSYPAAGGTGLINIGTEERCAWTAVSNDSWITITSGCCGTGTGSVSYSVAPNPDTRRRTGTITVADRNFKVKQKGGN